MTILEIRKFTKLTQQSFGEKFEIPKRTIEDWESGRRTPPPYVEKLLAIVTGYQKFIETNEVKNNKEI